MTGYTVHTGTSKKFISGWDRVFSQTNDKKNTGKPTGTPANAKDNAKKGKKKK